MAIYDEAAYGAEEMWTEVLLPALLERRGRAIIVSTPNGYNWFYDVYRHGEAGTRGYKAFHRTSYDNPFIPKESIDALRDTMTVKAFEQEILAIFSEAALGVFHNIDNCVGRYPPTYVPKPQKGHRYCAGIDWGKSDDFTVVSVWDIDEHREVCIEHFNQVGWEVQRRKLKRVLTTWGCDPAIAELNSIGDPNTEALQLEGVPVYGVRMTNQIKTNLVQQFALALEQEDCEILNHKLANEELRMFEQRVLPSGMIRYSAPPKRHDDTVIARILAWSAINEEIGMPVELDFDW